MKMIIEVSGGLVSNITATDEVSIYIIDHDEIEERGGDIEEARQARQPDYICDETNLLIRLDEILEGFEEA